ncbi:MAG: o-succinylbenzoate synthase [Bacteroidetes bacterium]|nr:o-succinylbenzoate synthase [Bacteroidota bacterium]
MKDLQLTYSPYTLKLKKSFFTARTEIKERRGFILRLDDPDGFEGIGDCCPFPEFGSESIEDVENVLSDFKLKVIIDETEIEKSINNCLVNYKKMPALRHGLEQAIINIICNKNKTTIDKLLNLKLKKRVTVNAAIGFLNVDESVKTARTLIEKGFTTIKLKIGRSNFEEDFSVIKLIRKTFGDNIKLRIDSNGNWNLDEAIINLMELEQFDIEYAEQPVTNLSDYIDLKKRTNIPLAPDESIRSVKEAKEFIKSGAVSYLILKPMMIGGLLPTLDIIKLAMAENITPVITSSFESAIGKTNAVIAAASVEENVAHGLGVADLFLNTITNDPFPIKSGKIILS